MIGYKLFRKMRDGYAPLFINKRQRLQPGVTYPMEDHPTKVLPIARAGTSARSPSPHI